ncbi:signal peptide peptidase SppA [bacterium]|nr:signal peptide peptidase SppA [bacterium]
MKKFLIITLLFVTFGLFAEPFDFNNTSVAAHEDFLSGFVNPAALGTSDNSSLTFLKSYEEIDFTSPYAVIFKEEGFSYLLESDKGTNQTIASGFNLGKGKITRNFYLGSSWSWKSGTFKEGALTSSFLYRPINHLSLGYVLTHPNDLKPQHRGGIAIRPFASTSMGNIVELTTDASWGGMNEDRGFIKPIVGVNTNFLGGISLGATYNIEEEEVGIRFSLSNLNAVIGSISNIKEQSDNSKKNIGYGYVSLNSDIMGMIKGTERKKILDLNITGTVVDENTKFNIGFISLKMDNNSTMLEILKKIEKAKNDPEIKGIFFKNTNFGASLAKRQEILTALKEFKETGKKVVFYYENISNINYAFAANIGDKIYLNPEGMVQLVGIGGASPYIKEMLDKLSIDFYNFRSHPYKTAGNMFSETEMTDAEREVMERLYGDLYAEMVEMIREGRGHKLAGTVTDIIDNGPYFIPNDALRNGLVDGLVEWHELDAKLEEEFGTKKVTKGFSEKYDYAWSKPGLDKVAVIYASGNIMSGKGQAGKTIGSETTARAIRKARKDPEVQGIILRVDSGGGSALASHIIAEEIRLCKTGKNQKPVIALMSGVAASGGYYISTWADEIIAQPTTITGSIGVIGMVPNLARLSNKVGVNWSEVKFGKNSTSLSLTREWTADEKEMFKGFIKASYDRFVNTVADSRGNSYEEINKLAMGQVWTGNQALKNGLIDKLGGFETAISSMEEKLGSGNKIWLATYDGSDKERLEISLNAMTSPLFSWYNSSILKSVLEINDELKVNSDEIILYKSPYNLNLVND